MITSIAISPEDVDVFENALSNRSIKRITGTIRLQTDESIHYNLEVQEGCYDELFELGYRYGFKKGME